MTVSFIRKNNTRLEEGFLKRPSLLLGLLILISFQISCSKMALRQEVSMTVETDRTGAIIAQRVRVCVPVKYISELQPRFDLTGDREKSPKRVHRDKSYIRHLDVRWVESPAPDGN